MLQLCNFKLTPSFTFSPSTSKQILSLTEHSDSCHATFYLKITHFQFQIFLYLVLILPLVPYPCVFLPFPSATLHILTPRLSNYPFILPLLSNPPVLVELFLMTTLRNDLALWNMLFFSPWCSCQYWLPVFLWSLLIFLFQSPLLLFQTISLFSDPHFLLSLPLQYMQIIVTPQP